MKNSDNIKKQLFENMKRVDKSFKLNEAFDDVATKQIIGTIIDAKNNLQDIFEKLPIMTQLNSEIDTLMAEIDNLRMMMYVAIALAFIGIAVGAIGIFMKGKSP